MGIGSRCIIGILAASLLVSCSPLQKLASQEELSNSSFDPFIPLPPKEVKRQTIDIRTVIGSGTTLSTGKTNTSLTLLVFTNQSCAYCREFHDALLPRLKEDFVDKDLLRLDIAILSIAKYPSSGMETAALFCAMRQGKSWEMHEALFSLTNRTRKDIVAAAKSLKLNVKEFDACLDAPGAAAFVESQSSLAKTLNVTLVPTLFLNDEKLVGLPSYTDLRGWIEGATTQR
jgi:protein-disulfide isomerase